MLMESFVYTLVVSASREACLRLGHKMPYGYIPGIEDGDAIVCMYQEHDNAKEALRIMQYALKKCKNMKFSSQFVQNPERRNVPYHEKQKPLYKL